MFFAIAALVVSAFEIAVGIWIGLSVAKYRRNQAVGSPATDSRAASRALSVADAGRVPSNVPPRPFNEVVAAKTIANAMPATSEPTETVGLPLDAPAVVSEPRPGKTKAQIADDADAPLPPGAERRTSPRRLFSFRQYVAPYHGGVLPGKASFREVECQDISPTGFSFLSTQIPDFDSLVIALGVPPRLTYLQAHIVNRFPVEDSSAPLYRIGCRFAREVAAW